MKLADRVCGIDIKIKRQMKEKSTSHKQTHL